MRCSIYRDLPPPYGLMSAEDKASLDAIPSTYATKAELVSYVRCVQTDSGYNLVNGDGDVIFSVVKKKSPQLTLSTYEIIRDREEHTITVTRLGDGAITVENKGDEYSFDILRVDDNVVTYQLERNAIWNANLVIEISVAETDEYESATAVLTINVS